MLGRSKLAMAGLLALALSLMGTLGGGQAEALPPSTVSITVSVSAPGTPQVANATVWLQLKGGGGTVASGTTGSNGKCVLTVLPGKYELKAQKGLRTGKAPAHVGTKGGQYMVFIK